MTLTFDEVVTGQVPVEPEDDEEGGTAETGGEGEYTLVAEQAKQVGGIERLLGVLGDKPPATVQGVPDGSA